MNMRGLTAVVTTFVILTGCWSIDSKAGPTPTPKVREKDEVKATPTPAANISTKETSRMKESKPSEGFLGNLPGDFQQPQDEAGKLLMREYGAVYLSRNGAVPPKKVFFSDEADVSAFQASVDKSSGKVGAYTIELQTPAMNALNDAIAEARAAGVSISARAADSGRRGYTQTETLWASRVEPGLTYWVGKGRVTAAAAKRIRSLSPFEQIPEILALEQQGIFFAKDLSKSIIYSVAPPGSSQHLSMLALDVKEFENPRVRQILANHGWYQTVSSDLPHFTFLGVPESELPGLGLKQVTNSGRVFWMPDIHN